ncbi:hypothetical protein E4T48_05513 [Aureobasidium sp. EXF-10727]|nr:hypothetical protein E4T48_05513 [Aureobasidium sp. EXF-10727]
MATYGQPDKIVYHIRPRCRACTRQGETTPCSICGCSYYCSIQCQAVDVKVHRIVCKSFLQFRTRPGPNVRRAIFFPVDRPHPEFVWLEMDERYGYSQPDLPAMRKRFLGDSKDYVWPLQLNTDRVFMTQFYPHIILACGIGQPFQTLLNESVSTLVGEENHVMEGPIIAYGQMRQKDEHGDYHPVVMDLDTTDLTIITNIFLGCHARETATIPAVKVYSNGERNRLNCRFESLDWQSSYEFADNREGILSRISTLFGMPLVILYPQKLIDDSRDPTGLQKVLEWSRPLRAPDTDNRLASLLLIDIGEDLNEFAQDFGTIPAKYRSGYLDNAIVVRKDKRPLEKAYLEHFLAWIEEDLLPLFTDANMQIKTALATELEDEDPKAWQRAVDLMTLRQKMLDRCARKRFYSWLTKEKGLSLGVLGKYL